MRPTTLLSYLSSLWICSIEYFFASQIIHILNGFCMDCLTTYYIHCTLFSHPKLCPNIYHIKANHIKGPNPSKMFQIQVADLIETYQTEPALS